MKKLKVTLKTLSFCFLLSGISCTVKVNSDMNANIDFSAYKTFAWFQKQHQFKNKEFDNHIIESNVKNFGSVELKKRGFSVDIDSPDVILDYEIAIQKKTERVSEPIYEEQEKTARTYRIDNNNGLNFTHPYNYAIYYANTNPGMNVTTSPATYFAGYNVKEVPYEEGTLTIFVIDRKTNKLIWKGWSVGTVTDEQTYESELHIDIKEIFKRFPMKKNKK